MGHCVGSEYGSGFSTNVVVAVWILSFAELASDFDVWSYCYSFPAYYIVCISRGIWNLPVQSMIACSHQSVLPTKNGFNRMVGGRSPKERRGEERKREDRTTTKRGKRVGHCLVNEYGSGFSTKVVVRSSSNFPSGRGWKLAVEIDANFGIIL